MSTIQDAIKSVQDYGGQFTKGQERHRGFLGDGSGTVYVADRDGYVYVRHRQAESADITGDMEPEEVLYSRADIPPIEGYPVIFGRDLDTESFQVLAHDNEQLLGWIFDKYIKDHHAQHEFNEYDTVWIQKQAMLPLLVHPTSPASTFVQVYNGWYQWDIDWHYFETTTSAELSAYVPTVAGQARFLLICIDGDTETLHYEAGDTFLKFMPPRDCEDRIPPPPEGKIPLAAIYLVVGETSFDWDIIYDVRLLFSGGGSMSTGSAPRDAAYVTLAYNDTLSAERLLSAGHGIVVTDNGANDTVVVSVDSAADYNWSGDHNFNVGEMGLPSGTSFPASPQDGDVFYRTDEDNLYIYDGSSWIEVGILVHNELTGLQGGQVGEYYHFTQAQHTSFTVVGAVGSALVSTGVNVWGTALSPQWMGTHIWGSGFGLRPTDATGQDLGDATHRWDLHTQDVHFEGATGDNSITIPDGLANALNIVDTGTTVFLRLDTTSDYYLIDPAGAGVKVGIGIATPAGHLAIYDVAIDTTAGYFGLYMFHVKTAGMTDQADPLYGIYSYLHMNQVDGVIGSMYGLWLKVEVTNGDLGNGTVRSLFGTDSEVEMEVGSHVFGDVYGVVNRADLNAGTVDGNVYGNQIQIDIEGAVGSIGGDVYGIYVWVDCDKDPTGSAYLLYFDDIGTNIDYCIYQTGVSATPSYLAGYFGLGVAPPTQQLDVYTDHDTGYAARFRNDGDNVNRYGIQIWYGEDTPAGTNYCLVGMDGDGGNDGGLWSVAGAFDVYNLSDKSLKTKIMDTRAKGCDLITKLKVRDFEYSKSPGFVHTGFVAQEVMGIWPNAVAPLPDSELLGLSTATLIPILTKAIQELDTRLIGLEIRG